MKEDSIDPKLIRRLKHDRVPRVVGGIAGFVFLGFACTCAVMALRAMSHFEAAAAPLKSDFLAEFTLCSILAVVHLLVGTQVVAAAIAGNQVGKLAVRLHERINELEIRLEKSEQSHER